VITSRDGQAQELGGFEIRRRGDAVAGISEEERQISPRERLSAEDVSFFRREMKGVFLSSDSPWEKSNKIRDWLTHLIDPRL
jgi:hypothetical protein